ncbi:MAG: hypothetical protein ACKN9V_01390 [Pseudomonadota bacterium]
MKHFICWILLLVVQMSFGEVPLPGQSNGFISVDELENSGQLEFKLGEKTEKFEFGKGKPHYAMGLLFSRKNLPDSFVKTIGTNQILQIAFGNRIDSAPDLITQFGSLTLKIEELPSSTPVKVPFQDMTKADKDLGQSAFLIMNSSQMRFSLDDQEKLKTTLFSESGELGLTTIEKAQKISLPNTGKRLSFKRSTVAITVDATIGTPFSGTKGSLKGIIQIPVFWPQGTEANAFVADLAETSLDKNPEISPPKTAPRTLASPEETLKLKSDKPLK